MRITYRKQVTREYWRDRWSNIPVDQAMTNESVYPLLYALQTISCKEGKILEAGCGAGRILRYFHGKHYDITGFDFIEEVITALLEVDNSLKAEVGDVTNLHYPDLSFRYVLAFGLFHNLEKDLKKAVDETFRILEAGKNSKICASFRADNIQNRLNDWLVERRNQKSGEVGEYYFHKMNLTKAEFVSLFEDAGFIVESIVPVENMSILYKFPFFRSKEQKQFDESIARVESYKLSFIARILQRLMMQFFASQFCNIYVLVARKP